MLKRPGRSVYAAWIACVLAVAMVLTPCAGTVAWAKSSGSWASMLRPGAMIGDGDRQDDYYIDYLLPLWSDGRQLVFINPHLRLGDDDQDEENLGIGYRGLFHNNRVIYGGNIYYDTIGTEFDNRYHQVGLGFEALSRWVDFRTNGYIVVSDRNKPVSAADQFSFGSSAILVNPGMEEALPGVDAEVSVLLPGISDVFETHATLGGFYYDSKLKGSITGWKGRIDIRPVKMLNLAFEYNEKNLDGDTDNAFFVGGFIEIPLPLKDSAGLFKTGSRSLEERMTEKVMRDRHIKTIVGASDTAIAYAPAIYVNSDNATEDVAVDSKAEPIGAGTPGVVNGTGSLEDPYWHTDLITTSPNYAPGAYVYVFSYDENPDTYNGASVPLLDDMVLWGEGYRNLAWGIGGDAYPILEGGSECVILANNNEVMGLEIQNCGHGIAGYNIASTYIHDNIIHGNGATNSGIHIENEFYYDSASALSFNYNISNNEIYDNYSTGVTLMTGVFANTSISDTVINNTFSGNNIYGNYGDGVYVMSMLGVMNGIAGSDVTASVSGSAINNIFTGNEMSGNSGSGAWVENLIVAAAYGGDVEGSVLASVSGSTINNVFTGNTASNNDYSGIVVGISGGDGLFFGAGNAIGAVAFASGGTVTGDVSAGVEGSNIVNVYTSNITNANGWDGIAENSFVGSMASVESAPFTVEGNVTSSVTDSGVSSTFTENISNENYGGGWGPETGIHSEATLAAYSAMGSSSVGGDVSSIVNGSSIEHTYTGNEANYNNSTGIYEWNVIAAWSDVYEGLVGGDVAAEVFGSGIDNTYSENEMSGNSGSGAMVENLIGAVTFVQDSDVGGGVRASVGGSAVNNTFTGNTADENGESGISVGNPDGSCVGPLCGPSNTMGAVAYASGGTITGDVSAGVEGSDIVNSYTSNITNANGWDGIYESNLMGAMSFVEFAPFTVEGSVTSGVTDSGVSSTFTDNIADWNEGWGFDGLPTTGIHSETMLAAWSGISSDTTVVGNVSSIVNGASIEHTYTGNRVSDNYGTGIYEDNTMAALTDVESSFWSVGGDATSSVVGSAIESTYTGNTVERNNALVTGIHADSDIVAWTTVDGSSVDGNAGSSVSGSSIGMEFEDNDVNDNGGDGIYTDAAIQAYTEVWESELGGDATSSVVGSTISKTYTGNTVTGNWGTGINSGYGEDMYWLVESMASEGPQDYDVWFGGDEPVTGNAIGAQTWVGWSDVYGSLTSEVAGSFIERTLTDNTVEGNYSDGVSSSNLIFSLASPAYTYVYNAVAATVEDSGITHDYSGNSMDGNWGSGVAEFNLVESRAEGSVDIATDVSATTAGSSIESAFTGNSMDENGGDGIYRESSLMSYAYVWETDFAGVGNITALTEGSGITGTYTGNSASYNGETGIDSYGELVARANYDWADVYGSVGAFVNGSSIEDSFTGNTVVENGGAATGISLTYNVDVSGYDEEDGSTSWIDLFMQGNEVVGNSGYGLYVYYNEADALFTGDLGGGALGSTGGNAFWGSFADMGNETGADISARSNWWGQDTGPEAGQIVDISGTTDASNWLTEDPFLP